MRASVLSLASAAATSVSNVLDGSNVTSGCQALQAPLGDALFFGDSNVYQYEAANFWSNTELMDPGCVFRPQSSAQLAEGIAALTSADAEFAVRGGGHMGIRVGLGSRSERSWKFFSDGRRARTISITVS